MVDHLLIAGVSFCRNIIGLVVRPYETYRRIVDRGSLWELVYIGAMLAAYFALASIVKTAAFRPFLLTKQFVLLSAGAALGYLIAVAMLSLISRLFGGRGGATSLALTWAYTLVPTTAWFLATSLLYVVLPPPRTERALGVAFSTLYLVFSATLFYWKVILGYLTLRFGMKLDLPRIVAVWGLTAPVLAAYSWLMYRWGIFKVPFL